MACGIFSTASPLVVDDIETGEVDTPDNDEADEHVDSGIGFDIEFGKPRLLLLLLLLLV